MDVSALPAPSVVVYLVVLLLVAVDALVPVVPGEAAAISAAVLTAAGRLDPVLLITVTAVGVLLGDHAAYAVGRRMRTLQLQRLVRRRSTRRAVALALGGLLRHGIGTLIAARFVPLGRTAATTTAGYLAYPRWRFLVASLVGGVTWAAYGLALGRVGFGFGGSLWLRCLVAVLIGLGVGVVLQSLRRIVDVRQRLSTRSMPDTRALAPGDRLDP